MRGGLTKYYCFERRRENPPAFVPPFLFSQPVASLKDYDTRCCWGEWREELYEKFDAQKGVLTLWPWNAHGAGVDEKKVFTAPRTIIFSNYSNWTFNLSLFNFAIKSEIEHSITKKYCWRRTCCVFFISIWHFSRRWQRTKNEVIQAGFWRTSDILGLTKKIRGTNPVSLARNFRS